MYSVDRYNKYNVEEESNYMLCKEGMRKTWQAKNWKDYFVKRWKSANENRFQEEIQFVSFISRLLEGYLITSNVAFLPKRAHSTQILFYLRLFNL